MKNKENSVSSKSALASALLIGCVLPATSLAADDQDPKAIETVRKAIKAKGNADDINRAKTFHSAGKYYMFGANSEVAPGQIEKWVAPNLFKIETLTNFGDRQYRVSGGRDQLGNGWGATNDEPAEVNENRSRLFLNFVQAQDWSNLTALVNNKGVTLEYLGETKRKQFKSIIKTNELEKRYTFLGLDANVAMIGIRIARKDKPDIACSFFFDKHDFLLLSIVHRLVWDKKGAPVEYETQYSNFRAINGVRFPMTEVSIEGGRAINKAEYEKITIHDRLEMSVFDPKK